VNAITVAGAAAAGFVVSRMLLAEPGPGLLERFADRSLAASWPLADPRSQAGLHLISTGFSPVAVGADWRRLFGEGAGIVLLESRRRLLDEPALRQALQETYRGDGFDAVRDQPSDHLGAELMYLAHLAAQIARAEPAAQADLEAKLIGFRAEHVDPLWALVEPELSSQAHTAVLQALPHLIGGFLLALEEMVAEPRPAAVSSDAR
jgi:TorA maturation chaperone TorD